MQLSQVDRREFMLKYWVTAADSGNATTSESPKHNMGKQREHERTDGGDHCHRRRRPTSFVTTGGSGTVLMPIDSLRPSRENG